MSTKKVPLADVLWDAANKHLATEDKTNTESGIWHCSCNAAAAAAGLDSWLGLPHTVVGSFIWDLGCRWNRQQFQDYRSGPERQGVRYMWLLLAMHVAEDEGIEIEVEA